MAQVWGRSDREQPNEPDRDNRIGHDSEGNTVRTLRSPVLAGCFGERRALRNSIKQDFLHRERWGLSEAAEKLGRKRPSGQSSGWHMPTIVGRSSSWSFPIAPAGFVVPDRREL